MSGSKDEILGRVDLIVKELARERHGLTTSEIYSRLKDTEYGTTERTVQRDMKILEGFFGIYGEDEARTTRWNIEQKSNDSVFHDEAAFAVLLTQLQLEQTGQKTLLEKLRDVGNYAKSVLEARNTQLGAWYRSVRFKSPELHLNAPIIKVQLLNQLTQCVLNKELIKVSYLKHQGDQPEEIKVTALALIYRGKVPYLVARKYADEAPKNPLDRIRQFPVSRIVDVSAVLLGDPQIASFDIDEFMNSSQVSYQIGDAFTLEMEIFDSVRREIEDAHLGANQKITPIEEQPKNWRLKVDVEYNQNLIHWLFGRAPYLRVTGPAPFKEMFYRDLQNALRHHEMNRIEIAKERTFQPFK